MSTGLIAHPSFLHVKSTSYSVLTTLLYSACCSASFVPWRTFLFSCLLRREIPRFSSPLMLVGPLPRPQSSFLLLEVPGIGFCNDMFSSCLPLCQAAAVFSQRHTIPESFPQVHTKKPQRFFFPLGILTFMGSPADAP